MKRILGLPLMGALVTAISLTACGGSSPPGMTGGTGGGTGGGGGTSAEMATLEIVVESTGTPIGPEGLKIPETDKVMVLLRGKDAAGKQVPITVEPSWTMTPTTSPGIKVVTATDLAEITATADLFTAGTSADPGLTVRPCVKSICAEGKISSRINMRGCWYESDGGCRPAEQVEDKVTLDQPYILTGNTLVGQVDGSIGTVSENGHKLTICNKDGASCNDPLHR